MKNIRNKLLPLVAMTVGFAIAQPAFSATIVAQVKDKNGNAVSNAVVYAIPIGTTVPSAVQGASAAVEQVQMKYEPFVSVVQKGTQMRFPNKDRADHHVKVLSGPQFFEFQIYSRKKEPTPITLDKPGQLTLQCLLHNWMNAHIYVVDTPYFNKTSKTGSTVLQDLPAGEYELHVTHPNVSFPGQVTPAMPSRIKLESSSSQVVDVKFDFIPKSEPTRRVALDY
ncbi:MAG: methylamine utilization protein [Casimicrobium sp.]